MYLDTPIRSSSLAEGTLSLTFDDGPGGTLGDGPGPNTRRLAEYLHSLEVPATFFVVGKHVERYPDSPATLQRLGHLTGNHTYDHHNLPELLSAGGDPVQEILRTDDLIRPSVAGQTSFVRAPYGAWSPGVARALNSNLESALGHVGPIDWDIDGRDWEHWQRGATPAECAARYVDLIGQTRRGIVLMHDSTADSDATRAANQTWALTRLLLPTLLEQGYRFVRLDEVPEVRAATNLPLRLQLLTSNGFGLVSAVGGGSMLRVAGNPSEAPERLSAEYLASGRVVLRTADNRCVSPKDGGGGEVLVSGTVAGQSAPLELIQMGQNRVCFRTVSGHYLTREHDAGGRVLATARRVTESELWSVVPD